MKSDRKANLRMRPLFTVVFIFSSKCPTFVCLPKKKLVNQKIISSSSHMPLQPSLEQTLSYLQVMDAKWLFIYIGSVCTRSQTCHSCQISTISPHSFNNEDPALCSSSRLLYPVTCLKNTYTRKSGVSFCVVLLF